MTTVIAVTNQKGGVGKTTSAVNIAYYMAKAGKTVLLVDLDPQGNATSGLGVDKQELQSTMSDVMMGTKIIRHVIIPTEHKNLHLAPSTPLLANTEVELAGVQQKFTRLKSALESAADYDIIIIDSPPSLSLLTVNGLIAAKYVLLPVQAEFYALEGLGQLLETMKLVRKNMNPTLDLIGVLPTMMDGRTTLSNQVYEEIKKHFPGKVFDHTIPRNIRLAEAPSHGLPVGAYDRWSKGARAYKAVTKEVLDRVSQ
ncbi:sporulation initiation inhibitor Soj [Candidatus Saccharibacteria bacterium RIFCSPHIGHO2_01_FULL_45_15]|nr:MAG: sporulation initiation inhibitor Soj [Candidatus Saccharibacteria bacterium RIFCSPHIGHO2_01_FULL_45_15]OGL26824.1 MAG: sporulation initiation inhibitor Soj [Candidatus Saccharibacteria bacterium RIFCSPHIGHO2_02_FULL_46_12]OGL32046.1 MAG: sporulation initiation inhibitor Soj [Candidatus Saccharibacteria bacterium RIFCSPHIGHO2_12_FULL_44_22]